MPTHLMLDLETLGNTTTAAVIEIGAVAFDPEGVLGKLSDLNYSDQKFYSRINLTSCLEAGLDIDASTLAWWMRQNESARQEAAAAIEQGVMLRSVLGSFSSWVRDVHAIRYWSHGASFDIPILGHAFRAVGYRSPWDYKQVRDTRTLFEIVKLTYKTSAEHGHTALADAYNQALAVQEAYRRLGGVTGAI